MQRQEWARFTYRLVMRSPKRERLEGHYPVRAGAPSEETT